MKTRNDYVFFYHAKDPYGWGSNWYPSPFTAPLTIAGQQRTESFPTSEHYMMARKAALFNDEGVLQEILDATGTTRSDLTYVKSLGRKVNNFDERVWVENRESIMLEGCLHKFRANPELKEALLATEGKEMVEASPRDRIWGIGFGEKNAMKRRDEWGLNLLGKALDHCREILKEEDQGAPMDVDS